MYRFWYNYLKPKYDEKAILWYMDTETFIVYIKAYYIYKDIAEDVEAKCKLQITSWKGYYQNDKTEVLMV